MSFLRRLSWTIALLISIAAMPASAQPSGRPFTIYAFLPWTEHIGNDGRATTVPALQAYLQQLHIQPVWVVYENRYASPWRGQSGTVVSILSSNKKDTLFIDEEKIKAIALAALQQPQIPVSFDTEFGNRFKPQTVQPGVLEIIRLFRKYNGESPLGVYAVAPQMVYAAQEKSMQGVKKINPSYRDVANAVSFLSPVLYYRYNPDLENWKKVANFSLNQANAFGTGKPVIPYLSFDYSDHSATAEQDAKARLTFLYQHGAAGCILWGSSKEKTVFDRQTGWSKALTDFAADHASSR